MNQQDNQEAMDLYLSGMTYTQVAERFGVSYGLIHKIAKQAGMAGRGGRFARHEPQRKQALDLWRQGWRSTDIANEVKVQPATVRNWVKSVKGGPDIKAHQDAEEAVRLYSQGLTIIEVAKALGRGENYVSAWLKDAGVEILQSTDRMTSEQRLAYSKLGNEAMKIKYNTTAQYRECQRDGCDETFRLKFANDNTMFCSKKCSYIARTDPAKHVTTICARPACANEFESWVQQHRVYCSRECWARMAPAQIIVRDDRYGDVKLDSGYEGRVWSAARYHNVPIKRVDREEAIELPGGGHWYAPDFVIKGRYVEVKGYEDDDDRERYEAWSKHFPDAPLVILRHEDLADDSWLDRL